MLFSVIYSVDVPKEVSIAPYRPKARAWRQTEGDSWRDYDDLGEEWEGCKHRKWCAILTKQQFNTWICGSRLYAEDVETMGSLGAPGLGLGISPAISFVTQGDCDAIQNAYVTPIPEVHNWPANKPYGEKAWRRLRSAILRAYR